MKIAGGGGGSLTPPRIRTTPVGYPMRVTMRRARFSSMTPAQVRSMRRRLRGVRGMGR